MNLISALISSLLIGSLCGFEIGKRYSYEYESQVGSADVGGRRSQQQQHRILTNVRVVAVWESSGEQVVKITLDEFQMQLFVKGKYRNAKTQLLSSPLHPIYAYCAKGKIKRIYCNVDDDTVLKKVKKSIAGLLFRQELYKKEDSCNTTQIEDGDFQTVKKDCVEMTQTKKPVSYVRSFLVRRTSHEEYRSLLNDRSPLDVASVDELLEMFNPVWSREKVSVESRSKLKLANVDDGGASVVGGNVHEALTALNGDNSKNFVDEETFSFTETQSDRIKCDLTSTTASYKKSLRSKTLGKLNSTTAFSVLLDCFRGASKDEIIGVLKHKKFAKILPQILDIVAFTGTSEAVDAAFEFLRFKDGDLETINRFLLPFAMNAYPSHKMITELQNALKDLAERRRILERGRKEEQLDANKQLAASLMAALGALAGRLAAPSRDEDRQLIVEVDRFLKSGLDACEDKVCILTHLKAIRTMALPSSRDLLMRLSASGGDEAYEALTALREMDFRNDPQCEQFCSRIFHELDRKQESQNRVLAAEMLMDCYSETETLQKLLSKMQDQVEFEVMTYLASKMKHKMRVDPKFKADILTSLKEGNLYYALAQKGDSVYFENQLIPALTSFSDEIGVNATYDVAIELTPFGVLNRHHTDVILHSPGGHVRLFTASSYTKGLSTFFATSDSENPEEADTAEPMAALEMVFGGVALPPVLFFEGLSDLMTRAFSGNYPVPDIRGNYLLAEHSEETLMRNGYPVNLRVKAIVSNAIHGSFELSLWSQKSKTTVVDDMALLVEGSASIKTNFFELSNNVSLRSEFNMNFVSNVEFYEQPYTSCSEASHEDVHIRYERTLSTRFPNDVFSKRRTKRKRWTLPGRSYALHNKNNEMCARAKR